MEKEVEKTKVEQILDEISGLPATTFISLVNGGLLKSNIIRDYQVYKRIEDVVQDGDMDRMPIYSYISEEFNLSPKRVREIYYNLRKIIRLSI